MKRFYDVYIQCARCNGEISSRFLTEDEPKIGEEIFICSRCANQIEEETGERFERFIITFVDRKGTYSAEDKLIKWYEDFNGDNREMVSDCFEWNEERGRYVPKDDFEIVSLTVWSIPPCDIPDRDWYTLKEVAAIVGKGEEGVRSDWKRGKFFDLQVKGYVQLSGSTVLVHRDVIRSVYGVEI